MTIQQLLKELLEAGYSQAQVAKSVGTTPPTIHRATQGGDVRYALGKAIEELHRKATKSRKKAALRSAA